MKVFLIFTKASHKVDTNLSLAVSLQELKVLGKVKPFTVEYTQRDLRQSNFHHKFLNNEPWYQVLLVIRANLSNIFRQIKPQESQSIGI